MSLLISTQVVKSVLSAQVHFIMMNFASFSGKYSSIFLLTWNSAQQLFILY